MNMAGRPTFLKSLRSKDKPALIRIIINAILLKSDDIFKIELSIRFNTYGPKIIPVKIIPSRLGNFSFLQIQPVNIPNNNI